MGGGGGGGVGVICYTYILKYKLYIFFIFNMNGRLVEETRQQKLPKDYISCVTACHDHVIFLV